MVHEFRTTQWTTVLAAARGDAAARRDALGRLIDKYWYPAYLYVRRRGWSHEDAADATQDFFARMVEKDVLRAVSPEKGRFRTFLLVCLRNFLIGLRERDTARKRGGGRRAFSLNNDEANERYLREPADDNRPEASFHRGWALALLECVLQRLADEFRRAGKEKQFEQFRPYLTGDSGAPAYVVVAAELGMNEGAVRTAVHRLRQRYGQLLREEISQTVSSPEEIEEEILDLFQAVGA